MSKFKVGDKVKFINDFQGYPSGFIAEVVEVSNIGDPVTDKSQLGGPERDYWPSHVLAENTVLVDCDKISPHYTKDVDGKDYLQRFFENSTPDEINGAMKFTIGKYIERLGKKDDPVKELSKVIDYATRWRDHLDK